MPRDSARAEDVNAALDALSAGMETLDSDINRALKLPPGGGNQEISLTPLQRAGLVLAFDMLGSLTAVAAGGRFRGNWITGAVYLLGDVFRDPDTKSLYAVVTAHTAGSLALDIAAGRARLSVDVGAVESERAAAVIAASNALASQLAATGFANTAGASASNASGSASASAVSAAESANSAALAAGRATSASNSASAASGSASAASVSAAAAAASALSLADGPVVSINSKTGIVVFSREDMGDYPSIRITSHTNALPNRTYIIDAPGIILTLPGGYAKGNYLGIRENIGIGSYYINFNGHNLCGQPQGTKQIQATFRRREFNYEDSTRGLL